MKCSVDSTGFIAGIKFYASVCIFVDCWLNLIFQSFSFGFVSALVSVAKDAEKSKTINSLSACKLILVGY